MKIRQARPETCQTACQVLGMDYIGLFDDFGNPVYNMMPPLAHSKCHIAKSWGQQHGMMPATAEPVSKQFNNRF